MPSITLSFQGFLCTGGETVVTSQLRTASYKDPILCWSNEFCPCAWKASGSRAHAADSGIAKFLGTPLKV